MESQTVNTLTELVAIEAYDLGRWLVRQSSVGCGSRWPEFLGELKPLQDFVDRLETLTGNCRELLSCRLEAEAVGGPVLDRLRARMLEQLRASGLSPDGQPKKQAV